MNDAHIFFGSQESKANDYFEVRNPYDGEVASRRANSTAADANKALEIAARAKKAAKASPLSQRVAWLEDVADRLAEQKETFARNLTKETAKPIAFSRVEVERCVETIRITAATMMTMTGETINTDAAPSGKKTQAYYFREPAGVVVAITPFNFPLNLVAHKLAPALAAGNAVVLKPTPEAPYTAYSFAKLFIESKHAVPDALSVVYGDAEVGSALVTSDIPRVISFTGSVPVGKIIMSNAGIKKVSLELGGNAATFVEKSADLAHAAARCAYGAFANSGQVCISLQRIYVDAAVYETFAQLMAEETAKLKVGSCYDETVFMSALINEESATRAKRWIDSAVEEGARLISGGEQNGNVITPAVLADVTDTMNVVCEEVFAPVVSLVKVNGFDEAVGKMNNSPYGLQFSIFTNDLGLTKRAIDEFEAGGVVINDVPTVRFDIQPYGGVKLSGVGREGAKYAIEEFTEIKSVVIC